MYVETDTYIPAWLCRKLDVLLRRLIAFLSAFVECLCFLKGDYSSLYLYKEIQGEPISYDV
jgi:hypothetical protein